MKRLKYIILILFILLIHPKLTFAVSVEAYPYTGTNGEWRKNLLLK